MQRTSTSLPGANENLNYAFEKQCICDGPGLRHLFEKYRPDAVMNLAAESHVDRSIDGPGEFIQTNIVGTFTLLQETLRYWRTLSPEKRKKFRFLHVSTDEVFGSLGEEGFFTETTAYAPNSPYSASKASSDHHMVSGTVGRDDIKNEIVASRPVCARTAWSGGGAHFVAIAGFIEGDLIEVHDPISGVSNVDYDVFVTSYQGSGLTDSYFTRS